MSAGEATRNGYGLLRIATEKIVAGPARGAVLRRLWGMMLAIFAGTALSAGLLVVGETGATTTALGLALVVYAAYALFARQLHVPARLETWLSPLGGSPPASSRAGAAAFRSSSAEAFQFRRPSPRRPGTRL